MGAYYTSGEGKREALVTRYRAARRRGRETILQIGGVVCRAADHQPTASATGAAIELNRPTHTSFQLEIV